MNDRQRLEAIIDVIGRYLPPDGPLTEHQAMNEIIGLVDPLPPAQPPRELLTEFQRMQIIGDEFPIALVQPIIIQKVDAVCLAIERAVLAAQEQKP